MEIKTISYYKINQEIKFNDGFILPAQTIVMLNYVEEEQSNVQYDAGSVKRIFWIHNSNIEFDSEKKERWSKKKIEQHNLDLNENWLEHEQNKRIGRATVNHKTLRRTKKNTTSNRIRKTKGETRTSERKSKNKKRRASQTN